MLSKPVAFASELILSGRLINQETTNTTKINNTLPIKPETIAQSVVIPISEKVMHFGQNISSLLREVIIENKKTKVLIIFWN